MALSSAVALGTSKWSFSGSDSATTNGTINIADRTFLTMPSKGDLISMDVGNSATTKFRVIKIVSDTVAEVLAMEDASSSQVFNSTISAGNTYDGSALDTYCNSTYFNKLSDTAKSAIVAKTITQKTYRIYSEYFNIDWTYKFENKWSSDEEDGWFHWAVLYYTSSSYSRYCYCLGLADIFSYVNSSYISSKDLNTLFFNDPTGLSWKNVWLRSAEFEEKYYAWYVYKYNGCLGSWYRVNYSNAVRPAFQIDLSKINFLKIDSI